tara:strand:+ start:176 stop:337 length:162 start_codon:yes stop_codon:yes gene_type:complete
LLIERILFEIELLDDAPAEYVLAKLSARLAEHQTDTENEGAARGYFYDISRKT